MPPHWRGYHARTGGNRRRVRLACDRLESRDATGNVVSGILSAAIDGPLADSASELARLLGDWAFLGGARVYPPAPAVQEIDEPPARKPANIDTWLGPDLPVRKESGTSRIQVTAPAAPAAFGRGVFDDLLGEQAQLAGPPNFGPLPSFVGVRAAQEFTTDSLPSAPRTAVSAIGAPFIEYDPVSAPFGIRAVVNADELDEPIPNEAPFALDDAVVVDEDGSVVFDPTANDADPDGDPLWVKSVQPETDNGRTYWEDGSIRYTPDPDFHGTDSFTYTVTDGLAEDTGTVTVTVNSVNDAPVAFNDAFTGNSSVAALPPAPPNTAVIRIDVLANDIDYDGSGLTVGALQAPGSVAISADKRAVEWSVPLNSTAQVEFTYQAKDDEGALSSMVTVEAWAYPITAIPDPPPPPTVVTAADAFAIGGDDVTTGNVTANDTGGKFAVLRTHPAGTRVDSFGFDGSVELTPTLERADASFAYALFSADGKESPTGTVTLSNVNLTIYHGQAGRDGGGKAASELNERVIAGGAAGGNPLIPAFKATGAFTVANLNDSNANGMVDSDPRERSMGGDPRYPGSGEIDLMRLDVAYKPPPGGANTVTLTVTPAAVNTVRIWKDSLKIDDPVLIADGQANSVAVAPGTYWVELAGVSGRVGDVTIKGSVGQASDTVSATAIWTKQADATPFWPDGYFMNTGTALPDDADARGIRRFFDIRGKTLGLTPNVPIQGKANWFNTRNNALQKFTVLPSGMTPFSVLGIVSFDPTRSVETNGTNTVQPGGAKPLTKSRPGWLDTANDELLLVFGKTDDGDSDLLYRTTEPQQGAVAPTDNIYYWDAPGIPSWQSKDTGVYYDTERVTDYVLRANFYDFVRIAFYDEPWGLGSLAGVRGSRSSVYYFWSSMLHLREKDPAEDGPPPPGALWSMKRVDDPGTVTENRIEKGLIDINVAGGGVT